MKRDLELYRRILQAVEACPNARCNLRSLDGVSNDEFGYHVKLMAEIDLIEAIDASDFAGEDWIITGMTHEGHEFLDAIKEDNIWIKLKSTAKNASGVITVETLKLALPKVLEMFFTR